MTFFEKLRSNKRIRKAIHSVCENNIHRPIVEPLEEFPDDFNGICEHVDPLIKPDPYHALLVVTGLCAYCNKTPSFASDCPTIKLHELTKSILGWDLLSKEHLNIIRRYLTIKKDSFLVAKIRDKISIEKKIFFLPDIDAPDFLAEFIPLIPHYFDGELSPQIAEFLDSLAFKEHQDEQYNNRVLNTIYQATLSLLQEEKYEDGLLLANLIIAFKPSVFIDTTVLLPVALALPSWIPKRDGMHLDGITKNLTFPVPHKVIRAANLFAFFPKSDWIPQLKISWMAVDDLVRRDYGEKNLVSDPLRIMAANAIAIALGTCTALDAKQCTLITNSNEAKKQHEEINKKIEEHNKMVEDFNHMRSQYMVGDKNEDAMRKLSEKVMNSKVEIDSLHQQRRESHTPSQMLLYNVNDNQSYPLEVRQGAAWGLQCILKNPQLEEKTRMELQRTLDIVLNNEVLQEEEIRTILTETLPPEDKRITKLLLAVEDYDKHHDENEFTEKVTEIAPEFPELPQKLQTSISDQRTKEGNDDFEERILRILPKSYLLECTFALRTCLQWMVELFDHKNYNNYNFEKNIFTNISLIHSEIPGIIDFLHKYPLRLMTLRRHKNLLGMYSRNKVMIKLWFRYTPPQWTPGAKPGEYGEVQYRFLTLEDRSTPNSMGIFYKLFEDPILALPILYHEFMHYAGPNGDPKDGRENETEVLMRETLFARYLIANMAPRDNSLLNKYEQSLAESIRKTKLHGLGYQLFYEFQNEEYFKHINNTILEIYGEPLTLSEALAKTNESIVKENNYIESMNKTDKQKLAWSPDKNYPLLDTPETKEISERYRAVLTRSLQHDHKLSSQNRNAILNEDVCQKFMNDWEEYKKRDGALVCLANNFNTSQLDSRSIQSIIQRFQTNESAELITQFLEYLKSTR